MALSLMTPKEAYQQAALILLGKRRDAQSDSVTAFIAKNRSFYDQLNACWLTLEDRKGVPSPDAVISWL